LLRDRRLRQGSYAWPQIMELSGPFAAFWTRSIISQKGPAHKAQRRLALSALSADFIDGLVPEFEASARALVQPLAGAAQCEFVSAFSEPFAGQAIATLLGQPPRMAAPTAADASALGLAMGVNCRVHHPLFDAACARAPVADQVLRDLVVISIFGGVDTTRAQLAFGMALLPKTPISGSICAATPPLCRVRSKRSSAPTRPPHGARARPPNALNFRGWA